MNVNFFRPRMKIIKDALQAHLDGKYTLSVPVLLAQVEGIMWDIGERKQIEYGKETVTKEGKKEVSLKFALEKTILQNFIFPNFVDYYTKKVYVEDNRHGILHGRSTTYPSEENSVLGIMMLTLLSEHCKEVEKLAA